MAENPSSDALDQQIETDILTQEILHSFQQSVLAGKSILFTASTTEDAVSFLMALMESLTSTDWLGFVICHVDTINTSLLNINLSNVLAQMSLGTRDIETVTAFHKFGTLIMNTVSRQTGLIYLQALLRGPVIAIIQAEDSTSAITALSVGINDHIQQISVEEARTRLLAELDLVLHLGYDSQGKLRATIV